MRAGWRGGSGYPVRWIEDRREQLTGNANCREHDYDITLHAEADGTLIGIDAEAVVDAGCVFGLSVFGVSGSGTGRIDPAGSVYDARLSLPHILRGNQQAADTALSRRRAVRRLLRAGSRVGRGGAPGRAGTA